MIQDVALFKLVDLICEGNISFCAITDFQYCDIVEARSRAGQTVRFRRIRVQKSNACKSTDGIHRPNSD